jgi:hypothetical protein
MKSPSVNLLTAIAWGVTIATTTAFVPGATFQTKFHSAVTTSQMAPMSWVSKSDNTSGNKGIHKPVKPEPTETTSTTVDNKDVVNTVVKNSTQALAPALVPSSKLIANEKKQEKSKLLEEILAAVELEEDKVVDDAPELLMVKNDEIMAEEVKEEKVGEEEDDDAPALMIVNSVEIMAEAVKEEEMGQDEEEEMTEEQMDALEEDVMSPEEVAQLDWDEKYMRLAMQMAQSAYVLLTLVTLSVLRFCRLDYFVVWNKMLAVVLLVPRFGLNFCLLLANVLFAFLS